MSALALLLAVLASVATAGEQTAVAVFRTRFVPPRRVDVSKLKELPDVAGVWIWTSETPPQRTDASLKTAPVQSASLTVRLETSVKPPNDLTLVAAPAAMWEEVPEPLLPATKVEFGKDRKAVVHVVVNPKVAWRLRLKGSGSGSWWIDVPPGQRQTTLALVAAPDRAVEVRGDDGKPVAEAAVTVLEEGTLRGAFRKLAEFRSDERGRLLFAGLPNSATPTILFGAAGRAPNVYVTNPSRIPAIVTLRRGRRVIGNVRNRSGAPIVGASIEVHAPISPTFPTLPLLREAKSDAEGRWEAGALPEGEGSWQIAAPAFATVTGRVKLDKDVVDLGTITLEPGVKVEVQVNDDRGVPITGAGIYTGDRTLATTNEKGHATVILAPKESIVMRAGAKHHPFAAKTVRATDRLVTFILTTPFRVTGRFVDSARLPVMDTKLTAHHDNMIVFPDDSRIDDGRFELDLDPDSEYDLELSSSRTSAVRVHVKPGALGEIRDLGDIVAPSALTVTGRLLRAGDASPVAGAHVWSLRPSPEGIVRSWAVRNIAETTSGADGTFTLSGMPLQSPFDLRVDAPSLAPIRKSFTPAPASDHVDAGDITLTAGATVVIRLQNDTGDDANGRVNTGGMFFSREPLSAPFENGVARITGVPPGPALVSASRRRDILCRQKVTIPESGDDVEIICNARKVTIAGTVTVGGSPAGRGSILWRQGPHDSQSAMQDPYYSPDQPQETVEVGPDGRFDGPRLMPGVWDVMWMPELGRSYAPKTITVADVEVQNVTLEYPGVSVDGIVLDANRRPVKAAMVRDLGRQGFALTHDDGTFTIGGPEPGTWRLQARFADQASAVKEVVVEDRPERPHVELILGAGESNVRVAAGPGAMVFLDVDSGLLQMASTDDAGIATFHLQPPLPTRVRVAATVSGRWTLGDWIDWPDAIKVPLELKTPEAGNIVLRTKGATGPVSVTSTNGWRIDLLFQWVGAVLRLGSGNDVTVTGLPPGSYTIGVSNQQRTASVERDKTLEITFD